MPTFSLQQKHAAQDQHIQQTSQRLDAETVTQTHTPILSLLGDQQQLRGIPAIGRGVTGAIVGTNPIGAIRTALYHPGTSTPHAEPHGA